MSSSAFAATQMRRMLVKASAAVTRVNSKLTSPTRRLIVLVFVILWVNIINYTLFHHRHQALGYIAEKISSLNPLNNDAGHAIPKKLVDSFSVKLLLHENNILPDPRRIETHSQNYDDLFSRHPVEQVLQLSFAERCDAFFRNLYVLSDSWALNAPDRFKMDMEYETPWDDYKSKYEESTRKKLAESQKKSPADVSGDDIHNAIAEVYDGLKDQAKRHEREIQEHIALGRIFNKCYVTTDTSTARYKLNVFTKSQSQHISRYSTKKPSLTESEKKVNARKFSDCKDLESRLYPWLSHELPEYERFTGEVFKTLPVMSNFVGDQVVRSKLRTDNPIKSKFTGNRPCWLNALRYSLNGKGIVIPFHEDNVDNVHSLIRLLRGLRNELPIQLVSNGPFSALQKQALNETARGKFTKLPETYGKVKDSFGQSILVTEEFGLMQQELWFVDASKLFIEENRESWKDFPLSILATFASSFEEVVLLDPSAVPLKKPEFFFNQREYIQKGAYFYRAKPMHTRKEKNIDFFNRMAPSLIDHIFFNIPFLTAKSLDIPFFAGLQEVQDPGVFVIDKHQHFAGINSLLQLGAFWPASYRGDVSQELWLGLLVSGDEDFHFNKFFPGALGELTSTEKGEIPQICSAHTGHLNPEAPTELLWITNGLVTCPQINSNAEDDFGKAFKWKAFKEAQDLQHYYNDKLKVTAVVVPPFQDVDSFDLKNDDGHPVSPWEEEEGCAGMIHCANSEVGGKTKYGSNKQSGQFFEFEALEIDLISFLADIWISGPKE